MEDGRPAYSPSPPCHWTRTINPLYLDDRELPTPPTICSEPLAREYATLKDAINFQAKHRTAPDARPSNYDIDLRSNKILELTGDAAMRLAVITVARRRYPGLNAGGIDWLMRPLIENITFSFVSWYYRGFIPVHRVYGLEEFSSHHLENQGIMANLFEAYAGALSLAGQTAELEDWLEALWAGGVFGDLDGSVEKRIAQSRESLQTVGANNLTKKLKKQMRIRRQRSKV